WDVVNGNMISILDYKGEARDATFSPNANKVTLLDEEGIWIFDIKSGNLEKYIEAHNSLSSCLSCLVVSKDETMIGTALNDEFDGLVAAIWDLDTGSLIM